MTRIILLTALTITYLLTPIESSFNIFHIPKKNAPMQRSLDAVKSKKKKSSMYQCFPGDTKIKLSNGATIPISKLRIGDMIQTGRNTTSRIYMFTHAESHNEHNFIKLETRHGNLTASSGHLIIANNRYMATSSIRVGDLLETDSGLYSVVNRISHITAKGLYHPQTLDGSIIVDGFIATTYTLQVPITIATPLLSPFRSLFGMTDIDITRGTFEHDTPIRSFLISLLSGK